MDGRGWFVTDEGSRRRLGAVEGGGRGQAASGRFQTRKRKRNRVSVIAESARASRREEKKGKKA